jgi:formylglycine-generating enzyme required for sulfatase activity
LRGGSWYFEPRALRVSYRYGYTPVDRFHFVGIRVAQDL